jgi:hypothetical protein
MIPDMTAASDGRDGISIRRAAYGSCSMSRTDVQGTFVIVGAQKCGTTALSTFMSEHPEICVTKPAETHFFDRSIFFRNGEPPYDEFHRTVFKHYQGERAAGWSTPSLMFAEGTIERLAAYNPGLKLIVLLRHPAERAYSHYLMQRQAGLEQLTFRRALECEPARLEGGTDFMQSGLRYSYASRGLYGRQLGRLLRYFAREQILFLEMEKLQSSHQATLSAVYSFLGVGDPPVVPAARRIHAGTGGTMDEEDRARLLSFFQDTVTEVEDLLGWSLPAWRK